MPVLLTPSAPLLFRFSIEERNCFFDPAFASFAWISPYICLESFCALMQRCFCPSSKCSCLLWRKLFMATHPCVQIRLFSSYGCFMAHLCFAALDCVPSTRLSLVAPFTKWSSFCCSLFSKFCAYSLCPLQIVSCWSPFSIPFWYSQKQHLCFPFFFLCSLCQTMYVIVILEWFHPLWPNKTPTE